jgi:hypothetical protein
MELMKNFKITKSYNILQNQNQCNKFKSERASKHFL